MHVWEKIRSTAERMKGRSSNVHIIQVWADIINVMDRYACSYEANDIKEEKGSNRLRICKEVKQQHFIPLFTKKLQ